MSLAESQSLRQDKYTPALHSRYRDLNNKIQTLEADLSLLTMTEPNKEHLLRVSVTLGRPKE